MFKNYDNLDELVKHAEDYDFDFDYDVPDTDVEEASRRFHLHIQGLGKELIEGLDLNDLAFFGQGEDAAPSDAYLEAKQEFEEIVEMEYQDILGDETGLDVEPPSVDDVEDLVKEYFTGPAEAHFRELQKKRELQTTTFSEEVRENFQEAEPQGLNLYMELKDSKTPKTFKVIELRDNGIVVQNVSLGSDGKKYLIRDEVLDASKDKFRPFYNM